MGLYIFDSMRLRQILIYKDKGGQPATSVSNEYLSLYQAGADFCLKGN